MCIIVNLSVLFNLWYKTERMIFCVIMIIFYICFETQEELLSIRCAIYVKCTFNSQKYLLRTYNDIGFSVSSLIYSLFWHIPWPTITVYNVIEYLNDLSYLLCFEILRHDTLCSERRNIMLFLKGKVALENPGESSISVTLYHPAIFIFLISITYKFSFWHSI